MSALPDMLETAAEFSTDRQYRYSLTRIWDRDRAKCLLIGLNPSKADENYNDPTIRRCIGFAWRWGYGGIHICNLYGYMATHPRELFAHIDPVGADNDRTLLRMQEAVDDVILAYGNHGLRNDRHRQMLAWIKRPLCIRKGKSGLPLHPLYLKYTEKPLPYHQD